MSTKNAPLKHWVVYGPQGSGKSANAEAIAAFLGVTNIIDEGAEPPVRSPLRLPVVESLILTCNEPTRPGPRIMHIDDALRLIGVVRVVASEPAPPATALDMLEAARSHMRGRSAVYDKPEGERSMGRTVAAFNAITGHDLAESQGWLFMQVLKSVRDQTAPGGHADSQEDNVAYAALGAEARRAGR